MVRLKQRYRDKWRRGNARERIVMAVLDAMLPPGYTPVLVGLGAGSDAFIPRSYRGLREAFDIAVLYDEVGAPAVLLDVTGVASPRDAKPGLGYCIGTWKLDKARQHGVLDMAWAAFVIDDEPTILWAPYKRFLAYYATKARLYRDERPVRCLRRGNWRRFSDFTTWLVVYGPAHAKALASTGGWA